MRHAEQTGLAMNVVRLSWACGIAAILVASVTASYAQEKPEQRPMQYDRTALDNAYVTVSKDSAHCAKADPGRCEDRVILAMTNLKVTSGGHDTQLKRGEIAVFKSGDSYELPGDASYGSYYEIAIKPNHPPVKSPPELIRPAKNALIYDGPKFFVYREQLAVGDTRARHSHSQRVEIRLSNGPMLHQWVWEGDQVKEIDPSRVNWREPMIHEVRNVGDAPLDNFILEFLPEK
jgi:hypothetical protein